MTLGGKGLCAYNPDMRLYEHAHARRRGGEGGGATPNIEPDYIMHVHVAMAGRDEVNQLLVESVVSGYRVCKTVWTMFVEEILTVSPETVCLMKMPKSSALCLALPPHRRES